MFATSSTLLCILLLPLLASALDVWLGNVAALLQDCPLRIVNNIGSTKQNSIQTLAACARRRALAAIDHILQDDTIPILNGLQLVNYNYHGSDSAGQLNNSLTFNVRDLLKRIRERESSTREGEEVKEENEEEGGWHVKLIKRLARVLKTHVIKIDLERTTGMTSNARTSSLQVEPRGRRRRRRQMQMMPIIMMGVLLMGSVLIPMGFQFLAVLGGKALILAKMALMLSSIQGLKKIATNGVNYGLYHSPVPEPWHERSTAGVELPSYALSYANSYSHVPASSAYLEPATNYIANRRSAPT